MSVSTTVRKVGFNGNGIAVAFPFAFKVFQQTDVLVVLTDSLGNQTTQALTSQYSVSLNAEQDTSPGGTVTMVTAPPTGYTLTIGSQLAALQSTVLTNTGGFFPTVLNNALDYLTILVQQILSRLTGVISFPFSDSSSLNATLPTAAQRANTVMAFDAGGNVVQGPNIATVGTVASNVANINSVAGDLTNINSVAGDLTNINSVATSISSVNAVAGNATNINNVAANNTNVTNVGANIANVNSVAGNATNINAAVGNAANINAAPGAATNAANSATAASTSATNAANSATAAAGSASAASTSATNAANASRLAIGTVTTGAAGSSAAATITGSAGSQSLNLTIPQGLTGSAGSPYATSAYRTSGFTISGGNSFTLIPFDTVEYDAKSCFNTSTNRYTAQVAGIHRVDARVEFSDMGDSPGAQRLWLSIFKNGSEVRRCLSTTYSGSGYFGNIEGHADILCAVGDYIQIYVWAQNSFTVANPDGASCTYFQVSYAGPNS